MMTPLRRRMLEDMQLRNLCPEMQRNYVHHICGLARFYRSPFIRKFLRCDRLYKVPRQLIALP